MKSFCFGSWFVLQLGLFLLAAVFVAWKISASLPFSFTAVESVGHGNFCSVFGHLLALRDIALLLERASDRPLEEDRFEVWTKADQPAK